MSVKIAMESHHIELTLLAIAWLAYGGLHSLLASLPCKAWIKQRWPHYMYSYRTIFNTIAIVLLIPILAFEHSLSSVPLWAWSGFWQTISLLLMLLAIAGFIWSTRYYDMSLFLGTKQWQQRNNTGAGGDDLFAISPLHRFVRHPWYSFALVLLWARDMDSATLTSTLMISGYFIIGARLEEQKLVQQFGERYQQYQRQVPALLPRPWCYLSGAGARKLTTTGVAKAP